MAETSANEAAQRYAAIEQAYSKENWASVLQDGGELLSLLRESENPQLMGLQMRLQLLLGHTQLYGYADKAAASGYYGAVAEQSSEAALTNIAAQGMKQCAIDEPPSEAATAEPPAEAVTTVAAPIDAPSGPAAPWLTAAATGATQMATAPSTAADPGDAAAQPQGEAAASTPGAPWSEPSLIPEVVEEPELIELHQADPSLAEDVELDWKEPLSAAETLEQADADLVSGLMLVQIG